MSDGRNLSGNFRFNFTTVYKKTDEVINQNIFDNVRLKITDSFTNGRGAGRNDLQFYEQFTINNNVRQYNLDDGSLKNKWQDSLDYDAVKILVIRNRETDTTAINKYLNYTFKTERGVIGPTGSRIILEPVGAGISPESSSGAEEEGMLTLWSNGNVLGDVYIVGASDEVSSSSSGS